MTFWDGNGWVNEVPARSKSTLCGHRCSLVALVIVGALAIGALPLLVTGASPTLTISPTRAVGGVTVTLAGMGFVPRTTVQIAWDGSTKGMPTASVTGQGGFKVSISVPPTASAGSHTISVSGTMSGRVAPDANVVTEIASASVLVQSGSIASAGRSTTVSRTAKPDGPEKPSTTKSPRGGSGPAAHWGAFISFVANRRNTVTGVRYADDPTIAIVAFAGEVEPVNSTANSLGVTTLQVTNFFKKAFASWGAIDPNHLLSSGGLLQLDWNSGIDWRTIFALPGSDLCSIHDYSRADQTITTPSVASYCASIGRPWITEEFGWEQAT